MNAVLLVLNQFPRFSHLVLHGVIKQLQQTLPIIVLN
eukprot:gene64309-87949_t